MDDGPVLVLCMDALTKDLVEKYNCKNLMQKNNGIYGNTDISDFEIALSNILWPSFLEMKNKDNELVPTIYHLKIDPETVLEEISKREKTEKGKGTSILKKTLTPKLLHFLERFIIPIPFRIGREIEFSAYGKRVGKILGDYGDYRKYFKQTIVDYQTGINKTFLRYFSPFIHIDFPTLDSYRIKKHRSLRRATSKLINMNATRKEITDFNRFVWKLNIENELELFDKLKKDKYKLVLYFNSCADYIGHHNFGSDEIMKKVYTELDALVERLDDYGDTVFIVSDHGMYQVIIEREGGQEIKTRYGNHLDLTTGFYGLNRNLGEIREMYERVNYPSALDPLRRLEEGSPKLTDIGHIVSLYGNRLPKSK